jgi:3-hydroxy-9,10-secoandrosta-1,3,5(10)-triene-9,17-dione monooxygenase
LQSTQTPTAETVSLVDKARDLHDFIASHREENEKNRRVSDEVMDALKESGIIRGLQSVNYGGLEVHPAEWYQAMVEVSSACPSTGWLVGILGVHPFEFAQMSIEMQDELYRDDPNTLVSSSYAPQSQITRVPGGFRIKGQHRTSSGVDHAQWVVVGGVIPDEAPETGRRTFVIPMKDVRVVDDWFVVGLSGTGSKSIAFDDIFVPDHRSASRKDLMDSTGPGMAINDRPLFHIPHGAVYGSAGAGPAVGVAKAAYREYLKQIATYTTRRTGQNKAEDPLTHLRIGDAQSLIEAAESRTVWAYNDMYAKAVAGEEITLPDRAHYSWRMAQAADDCVTAVRRLFESRGASAVFLNNPLQAYYRDIITMRQHGTQDRDARTVALARAELGLSLEDQMI